MLKGFRGNTLPSCPIFLRSNKMTTGNTTHNGWTNYATWRVNLEMFDTYDTSDITPNTNVLELAQQLKESALCFIEETCDIDITRGWAIAFLEEVNFYEIAQHMVGSCVEKL